MVLRAKHPAAMASDSLVRDPIYQQLTRRLRDLITSGEFPPSSQFLTERQVGERFGISRITANKALAALVSEGVLEFRKGVGTFVRSGVLDYNLERLMSFTAAARAAGKTPSTKVLTWKALPVGKVEPAAVEALNLAGDDRALYMERLRLADGVPIIFERRYVPLALAPQLEREHAAGSMYDALTAQGTEIAGAEQRMRAVSLTEGEASSLGVKPGEPALRVVGTGFTTQNRPLWWEETTYRGDAYEFRTVLGPLARSSASVGSFVSLPTRARSSTGRHRR